MPLQHLQGVGQRSTLPETCCTWQLPASRSSSELAVCTRFPFRGLEVNSFCGIIHQNNQGDLHYSAQVIALSFYLRKCLAHNICLYIIGHKSTLVLYLIFLWSVVVSTLFQKDYKEVVLNCRGHVHCPFWGCPSRILSAGFCENDYIPSPP